MSALYLNADLLNDPRIGLLTPRAFRAWIAAICYTAEHDTLGTFPRAMARRLGATPSVVRQLIERGLWAEDGDSYLLEDYDQLHKIVSREPRPWIDRDAVLKRHGLVCGICGEDIKAGDAIHIDHIVPFSKGGTSEIDNLQPTHAVCNMRKGARAD